MKACAPTAFAASITCSRVMDGSFKVMLLSTVSLNRKTSCNTVATLVRSSSSLYSRMSCPSSSTRPSWYSYARPSTLMMLLFPLPVAPTSAIISPAFAEKLMPCSTGTAGS